MPEAVGLVVAAGSGQRFGSQTSKVLLPLAGKPLFLWSVGILAASASISRIHIAVRPEDHLAFKDLLDQWPCRKLARPLVFGGATRSDSVKNLLAALAGDPPRLVLIHDAARPFPSPSGVDAVIAAAAESGAASFASPVTDTLKRANEEGLLGETVPREGLWAMQTPQAFDYERLVEAYRRWPREAEPPTDETTVMFHSGVASRCIQSGVENLKITHREDLALAEAMLAARKKP